MENLEHIIGQEKAPTTQPQNLDAMLRQTTGLPINIDLSTLPSTQDILKQQREAYSDHITPNAEIQSSTQKNPIGQIDIPQPMQSQPVQAPESSQIHIPTPTPVFADKTSGIMSIDEFKNQAGGKIVEEKIDIKAEEM